MGQAIECSPKPEASKYPPVRKRLKSDLSYTIVSLGCPKNRVDTEKIMYAMSQSGYSFTEETPDADIIIINTCAFIEMAVEESINTILDHVEENHEAFLVVAGCLPMRYRGDAAESLPEVDLFLEPKDIPDLPNILGKALRRPGSSLQAKTSGQTALGNGRLLTTPGYAYLRVSDGCDRKCAYCSIPMIRGSMISEPIEKLEAEAIELAAGGASELVLVAQDLCSYGLDVGLKNGLNRLLVRLEKIDQFSWIRLMYLHPNGFPKGLFSMMRDSEKILPYLDIPIQHISENVLKNMGRPWKSGAIKKIIETARNEVPGIVLRTTVMVGYPGESDDDFDELRKFVEWAEIDRVGVFAYSPEEGTRAFELSDTVTPETKQARMDEIVEIHSRYQQRRNRDKIGDVEAAIVEGYSSETELLLQGRLWDQAPEVDGSLFITDGNAEAGGIYRVRINEFNGPDFFGEIV